MNHRIFERILHSLVFQRVYLFEHQIFLLTIPWGVCNTGTWDVSAADAMLAPAECAAMRAVPVMHYVLKGRLSASDANDRDTTVR